MQPTKIENKRYRVIVEFATLEQSEAFKLTLEECDLGHPILTEYPDEILLGEKSVAELFQSE